MLKRIAVVLLCSMYCLGLHAQTSKTENIIIVTLDGMRWQEVFGGVDPAILHNSKYTKDTAEEIAKFWSDDLNERRKKLFPFFWNTIAKHGQLYGNRNIGNLVNVANPYKFSYPGYNEMFTGYPDTAVNSNDNKPNKNTNVLEFISRKNPAYKEKIAVFSTWETLPYILNKWRNGIFVNSNVDTLHFNDPSLQLINDIQLLDAANIDGRPDILTYIAAREYFKAYKPKILYISFDETDHFAHHGMYDQYITSAHAEDGMIADIWRTAQATPGYKDKTTLIVLCDHGRGDKIKDQWRDHGAGVADAGGIWIAIMGPDTPPTGEVNTATQLYQKQIAPTIAALLGMHFTPDHGTAEPITTALK